MKTTLLFAATFLLAIAGYSQTGRPSFGVRAGVNFQNLNGKQGNGDQLENDLKVGFNAGVNAELPVAPDFYLQPGILFSTKGARQNNAFGNEDAKIKLSYIEVPVNLLYKPLLGEGRLLLGFGPYIAYGIGGKYEIGDVSRDIKWENEISGAQTVDPYFKRLDAGANLLFGYELSSKLSAQLNAQLGLLKINPRITGQDDESTTKNTGFGVSVGYRF